MFESREFEHEIVVETEDEIDIINSLNSTGDKIKKPNIKDYVNYLGGKNIHLLIEIRSSSHIIEDEEGKRLLGCNTIERVE